MQTDITEIKETVNLIHKTMVECMDTFATTLIEVRDRIVDIEKCLKTNLPKSQLKIEAHEDVDNSFQSDLSSASKSAIVSSLSSGSKDTAPIKYKGNNQGKFLLEVLNSNIRSFMSLYTYK
mmetsp:Transcript_30733/g.44108  ORF Transcript_30733/g.44108 Transcript_30733/m.44108 type:complete len:121 (+) Transcript_30733:272-634(+)